MDAIIEKISTAAEAGENLRIKVNRQHISLYSDRKDGKRRWTVSWHEGIKRKRKMVSTLPDLINVTSHVIECTAKGTPASLGLAGESQAVAQIPLKELIAFYKRHHPNLKETLESPDLRSVADEFIQKARQAGRSTRHISSVKQHLSKACGSLPTKIGAITVQDIDEFLQSFKTLRTRLNHRITLVTLFRYAQRKGILDYGAPTAAEKSEKPTTIPTDPEILTPKEMTTLLEACNNPKLKAFLILGGFCGLRSAEICRLNWEQVRDDHIILGASITKTARRRIAEVPENAQAWLSSLRKEKGAVSYVSTTALYDALRALCAGAKVTWKQNALRHSFASYHLELHRDPPRTSKTAGHSLRVLETTYAKLVSREEAAAWFSLTPTESKPNEQPTTP